MNNISIPSARTSKLYLIELSYMAATRSTVDRHGYIRSMYREEMERVSVIDLAKSHAAVRTVITEEFRSYLYKLGKDRSSLLCYFNGCLGPHEIVDEHCVYVHQMAL